MLKWINKKMNKKGFTLVELVVVIAILAILAAIAVPRLTAMRYSAAVNSDGATATSIASAARIQETETGEVVTAVDAKYMVVPNPQAGGTFVISGGGDKAYVITWTSTAKGYEGEQSYTEGTKFQATQKGTSG